MRILALMLTCFIANLSAGIVNCNQHIAAQEKAHGIPVHLLKAISLVESGKKIDGTFVAWPWTINVEGKGYIFKTKREAVQAVRMHQIAGKTSIDVGPMQINLKHHAHAFRNLDEAFDPQKNIAYGAKFLTALYEKCGNWNTAVAYYHSASPKFHNSYKQKVLTNWNRLCKSSNNFEHPKLAQTALKFDDVKSIKSTPQTAIKPYAKVKRIYYSINGNNNRNLVKTCAKSESKLSNGRMYYSLD